MKNDSKTKMNRRQRGGVESAPLGRLAAGNSDCGDFTPTINFLTSQVRALIEQVGSRVPTPAEQREARELLGRIRALRREGEKHNG